MGLTKFYRNKYVVLLAVAVVVSLGLLMPNLRQDTLLVPVRTDRGGGAPGEEDIVISLYPPNPFLTEGESFQLICTVTGAEQVYFKLPRLNSRLLSSVKTVQQYGKATLTFSRLELGHQASYICHAVSVRRHLEKKRVFEVVVFPSEKGGDGEGEEEGKEEREGGDVWEMAVVGKEGDEEEAELEEDGEVEGGKESDNVLKKGEQIEQEREGEEQKEMEKEADGERERKGEIAADLAADFPVFETMEERAQYQREKVDEFCTRYGMDEVKFKLPTPIPNPRDKNNEVYSYNRHLLVDPQHNILFCFVPKVGCTNLKLLVFVSQGIIRRSELAKARDAVNQRALEGAMYRNSFISMRDNNFKVNVLKNFYKYTMFRNPLERLASGYRSKVERFPLVGLRPDLPHFNWLRKDIYEATHPREFRLWKIDRGKTQINISFPDFIDYWANNAVLNKVDGYLDEHFLMISEMCQPCRTRFDFYGNFRHFDRDAEVLVERVGASSSDLRQSYYSDDTASTDQRMRLYYLTLSEPQKRDVLSKMALELEFHYTIFPEERDCHKQILDIDADLPL